MQSIHETLNSINLLPRDQMVLALRQAPYVDKLKHFLNYTFNPNYIFDVPEGPVPYKPFEGPDAQGQLYHALRTFYIFNKGAAPGLGVIGKQTKFISMLEGLDKHDANLVCYVKDHKKLPYENITQKVCEEAFPDLAEAWHMFRSATDNVAEVNVPTQEVVVAGIPVIAVGQTTPEVDTQKTIEVTAVETVTPTSTTKVVKKVTKAG